MYPCTQTGAASRANAAAPRLGRSQTPNLSPPGHPMKLSAEKPTLLVVGTSPSIPGIRIHTGPDSAPWTFFVREVGSPP